MSTFKDTQIKALVEGILLDSCGLDTRDYSWGLYTDLCGMSYEDALKANNRGTNNVAIGQLVIKKCNCKCCDSGDTEDDDTKSANVVTFTLVKDSSDDNYTLVLTASKAPAADYVVSYTFEGVAASATIPAGQTVVVTSNTSTIPYATIEDVNYSTSDSKYTYTVDKSSISSGYFTVTFNVDGAVDSTATTRYAETIAYPSVASKVGYNFSWGDYTPETMPANNVVINGLYIAKKYKIAFVYGLNGEVEVSGYTAYDSAIATPEDAQKEGYTLTWDPEVPDTMNVEAESGLTFTAIYDINTYKLSVTVYYNDQVVDEYCAETATTYGYKIDLAQTVADHQEYILENEPSYEVIGWEPEELPDNMPAHDINVVGKFKTKSLGIGYQTFYQEALSSGIDEEKLDVLVDAESMDSVKYGNVYPVRFVAKNGYVIKEIYAVVDPFEDDAKIISLEDYVTGSTLFEGATSSFTEVDICVNNITKPMNFVVTLGDVYTVTYELTGCTSSNMSTSIAEGETYTTLLTPDEYNYWMREAKVTTDSGEISEVMTPETKYDIRVDGFDGNFSLENVKYDILLHLDMEAFSHLLNVTVDGVAYDESNEFIEIDGYNGSGLSEADECILTIKNLKNGYVCVPNFEATPDISDTALKEVSYMDIYGEIHTSTGLSEFLIASINGTTIGITSISADFSHFDRDLKIEITTYPTYTNEFTLYKGVTMEVGTWEMGVGYKETKEIKSVDPSDSADSKQFTYVFSDIISDTYGYKIYRNDDASDDMPLCQVSYSTAAKPSVLYATTFSSDYMTDGWTGIMIPNSADARTIARVTAQPMYLGYNINYLGSNYTIDNKLDKVWTLDKTWSATIFHKGEIDYNSVKIADGYYIDDSCINVTYKFQKPSMSEAEVGNIPFSVSGNSTYEDTDYVNDFAINIPHSAILSLPQYSASDVSKFCTINIDIEPKKLYTVTYELDGVTADKTVKYVTNEEDTEIVLSNGDNYFTEVKMNDDVLYAREASDYVAVSGNTMSDYENGNATIVISSAITEDVVIKATALPAYTVTVSDKLDSTNDAVMILKGQPYISEFTNNQGLGTEVISFGATMGGSSIDKYVTSPAADTFDLSLASVEGDIVIKASVAVLTYTLTLVQNGTKTNYNGLKYNDDITGYYPEGVDSYVDADGKTWVFDSWSPSGITNMPASDLTITAVYAEKKESSTVYFGAMLSTDAAAFDGTTALSNGGNVEYINGTDVDMVFTIPASDEYAYAEENYDDAEFEAWEDAHMFKYVILIPSDATTVVIKNGAGSVISGVTSTGKTVTIDGSEYVIYAGEATSQVDEDVNYTLKINVTK